jgi:hypothetical protein
MPRALVVRKRLRMCKADVTQTVRHRGLMGHARTTTARARRGRLPTLRRLASRGQEISRGPRTPRRKDVLFVRRERVLRRARQRPESLADTRGRGRRQCYGISGTLNPSNRRSSADYGNREWTDVENDCDCRCVVQDCGGSATNRIKYRCVGPSDSPSRREAVRLAHQNC